MAQHNKSERWVMNPTGLVSNTIVSIKYADGLPFQAFCVTDKFPGNVNFQIRVGSLQEAPADKFGKWRQPEKPIFNYEQVRERQRRFIEEAIKEKMEREVKAKNEERS